MFFTNLKILILSIIFSFLFNFNLDYVKSDSTPEFTFNLINIDSETVNAGAKINGSVNVINLDKVWMNFEMIGSFNGLDEVVIFSEKNFTLNPGLTKQISFSINVPSNYCTGIYKTNIKAKLNSFNNPNANNGGSNISINTAVGKRLLITVNSANPCPVTTIIADSGGGGAGSSGGGGGGSSGGGASSSSGGGSSSGGTSGTGGPVESPSGGSVPATAPINRTESPDAKTEEPILGSSLSQASCQILDPNSDIFASSENFNKFANLSGILSMEHKIADNYSKIISEFDKKKKIKSIFRDLKDRTSLKYIAALYEMGIISDLSDKQFKPNKNVNRAEYLKLVILATHENFSMKSLKAIKSFKDVKKKSWYARYIAYALKNKLVQGYSDQTFRPKNSVNIVEALNMTFNAFGIKPETGLIYTYDDIPENSWYKDIVNTSIKHCIIKQPQNGRFMPNRIVTREQAAIIVYRVLKLQYSQLGVFTAITSQR